MEAFLISASLTNTEHFQKKTRQEVSGFSIHSLLIKMNNTTRAPIPMETVHLPESRQSLSISSVKLS
jgi:hypothetical protein